MWRQGYFFKITPSLESGYSEVFLISHATLNFYIWPTLSSNSGTVHGNTNWTYSRMGNSKTETSEFLACWAYQEQKQLACIEYLKFTKYFHIHFSTDLQKYWEERRVGIIIFILEIRTLRLISEWASISFGHTDWKWQSQDPDPRVLLPCYDNSIMKACLVLLITQGAMCAPNPLF